MKTPVVGFIGLGLMGGPMAMRLLSNGYRLLVFNRTKDKALHHLARGAEWSDTPADLASRADIVVTMVTNDAALHGVTEDMQQSLRRGGIHIDCSTVSPALTTALEKKYSEGGCGFLHSPVLGSIPQAADGSLLLFVGGDESLFAQAEPVLNVLGSKIWRFPMAAQASNMKLIMNSFIGGMIATLSQALRHGEAAAVDSRTILDVLSHSALNSTMYQTKGASIIDNNFAPRFFLENLFKDTNLFRDAAARYGVRTPVADTVGLLLKEAIEEGYAKDDYSALYKIFGQQR